MKKALTKAVLSAVALVILAAIIPLSANASSSNTDNLKTEIFSYLTEEMNLNSAAACGVMANIDEESDFNPRLVIVDTNGLLSGGLCQWNGGRFSNLRKHCAQKDISYLSVEGQLSYLKKELSSKSYGYIYDYLKNVPDTAQGAYDAAHYWCYYFEIPANRSSKSVQRANSAIRNYWPVYGGVELKTPELSVAKGTTYEPGKKLTVKWTSSGPDTDGYRVYLVSKNAKGEFDYDNAKVAHLGADEKSFTIKAHNMKVGTYRIYVYAYNKVTGLEEKSNVLTVKIKCDKHDYTSKITTVPTETKDGVRTHTCKVCGKVKETKVVYSDYVKESKVKNLRVTGITETKIKIRWDKFKNADGYRIYMKNADGWKQIGVASADEDNAFMVRNLDSNTKYSFKVKAYVAVGDKKIYTESSNVATATTEKASKPAQKPVEAPTEAPVETPDTEAENKTEDKKSSSDFTNIFKDFCDGLLNF